MPLALKVGIMYAILLAALRCYNCYVLTFSPVLQVRESRRQARETDVWAALL